MSNLGTLFVITAPSGAGKTSLVHAVVERVSGISISVSHTTRLPRPVEVDGESYNFVSEADFSAMIAANDFLEHAVVYGYHYGTSRAWVERQIAAGIDVILEIDPQGAAIIQEKCPNCVTIFILPPSISILEQRLRSRNQDADSVIATRLLAAKTDLAQHQHFDYLVVNEDFSRALKDLSSVIHAARCAMPGVMKRHQKLLAELLETE